MFVLITILHTSVFIRELALSAYLEINTFLLLRHQHLTFFIEKHALILNNYNNLIIKYCHMENLALHLFTIRTNVNKQLIVDKSIYITEVIGLKTL